MTLAYRVVVQGRTVKVLQSLQRSHLARFSELLETLKTDPTPWKHFDLRKIEGTEDTYRVRIGEYRVVYFIDKANKTVHILKFDTRGKVY